MKEIIRTVPKRTIRHYQCGKCKTKYGSAGKAKKCESMPTEEKLFRVGDLVSWREPNLCSIHEKFYRLKGKVTKIIGPILPDEEYNNKWLQGKLTGLHVFQYEVKWRCPHCKKFYSGLFYGMELKSCQITRNIG